MAKLSEEDAGLLVKALLRGGAQDVAVPEANFEVLAAEFGQLCRSGALASACEARLAGYLKRPVRCVPGAGLDVPGEFALYEARVGGVDCWLAVDPAFVASLADAMIGGEGEPSRAGLGSRAGRIAARGLDQIFAAFASALACPLPSRSHPAAASPSGTAAGGGTIAIGSQSYAWRAGVRAVRAPGAPRVLTQATATGPGVTAPFAADPADVAPPRATVEAVLEAARRECARILEREVEFGAPAVAQRRASCMPRAWLAVGMPLSNGTAMLALDEATAGILLACLLGQPVEDPARSGALGRTGLEAMALGLLHAFCTALDPAQARRHRATVLTQDALLAASPHDSIEHEIRIGERTGRGYWLVPRGVLVQRT